MASDLAVKNAGAETMAVPLNDAVAVERQGSIGWIVLTRPAQINAINDDIRTGVPQALRDLEADPLGAERRSRSAASRGIPPRDDALYRGQQRQP